MNTRFAFALLAAVLGLGSAACKSSSSEADAAVVGSDTGVIPPDASTGTGECDKAANVAKKAALTAAQPTLGVRSRTALTVAVSFASEAGDPSVQCSVDLQFKDSNGNGTLDGYEDWTKTAAERAADLLGRMSAEQKLALMAHATLTDAPSSSNTAVSSGLQSKITSGNLRFGRTAANTSTITSRATWANAVQELCESQPLGIPFVLSAEPAHSAGSGRTKAKGFSQWPNELSLSATDATTVQGFGTHAAQEYRAIGIRLALSPSADLLTEPRWYEGQRTFGEDGTAVGAKVAAYIKGFQGESLGRDSVACVVGHFPGSGPAKDGWDPRLEKGQFLTYPGDNLDAHLAPFQKAFEAGVAGVMPSYGVLETGSFSALNGLIDGTTLEQVGASFNATLLTDVLRTHYQFTGLVLAPWGVLDDAGGTALGAPWGVEASTRAQRAAMAVSAGVDQFGGLDDVAPLTAARTAGSITDAQIDAAATRALALMFALGLFEDPYVDAAKAASLCNTDAAYRAGLDAMNRGMVLLVNATKPAGWLNGAGDGTQTGDKGNAGNGSGKVLPAPPGEPYVSAGCSFYIAGDFDLDYVRSVSAGYGALTNDAESIGGVDVSGDTTGALKIALSDYVFIRVAAPYTVDPDSGDLKYSLQSLEYASNANAAALDALRFARQSIDAHAGSKTQIVVGVDLGRPSVLSEILAEDPSGLYVEWGVTDKVFLDVAFGIVNGSGRLPVGLPLSDAAVQDPAQQKEDVAGDAQHAVFVEGFGISTTMF